MALALGTGAVVLVVLLWELIRPSLTRWLARARKIWAARRSDGPPARHDPGRERRAEQRARALLRSCLEEEDWAMYRELGFLRVRGGRGPRPAGRGEAGGSERGGEATLRGGSAPEAGGEGDGTPPDARHAYLIYPHEPIIAFAPATGELLGEYCVAFPDLSKPYGSARLPDSDDVLAKWMGLTGDEHRLIGEANMHLAGRQVEPQRVRRDLRRLAQWERERSRAEGPAGRLGSVRAA